MSSVSIDLVGPAERPLVSNSSILLFSAFLAGLAFGQALPNVTQYHAVTASAAGVVAYIGLWYTTRVNEHRHAARVNRKLARKLERKLGQHVAGRA